jgi:hypothetical protein
MLENLFGLGVIVVTVVTVFAASAVAGAGIGEMVYRLLWGK